MVSQNIQKQICYKSDNFSKTKPLNITIPIGTTFIADQSFRGSFITNLTIPITLNDMRNWSFSDFQSDNFSIPKGIAKIDEYTFSSSDIKRITIPDTGIFIDTGAFMSSIINETFIPCYSTIGVSVFEDCENLTLMNMSSHSTINQMAFYNCYSLTNITTEPDIMFTGNAFYNVTNVTIVHYGLIDFSTPETRRNFNSIVNNAYVQCCYRHKSIAYMKPKNYTVCNEFVSCYSNEKVNYRANYGFYAAMSLGLL